MLVSSPTFREGRDNALAKMADRFYVNCPLAPGPVTVEGPEAHHLAVVCRLRRGDAVCLFNGDGREYPAEVREVGKRAVVLEVHAVESPRRESPVRLEVAAPLPKGDRAQFLIEKLTELGVAAFTPLQTARSVVHPRETKLDKLQRYVIEASKQCGRNTLMGVGPLTEWSDFLRGRPLPGRKVLRIRAGGRGRRESATRSRRWGRRADSRTRKWIRRGRRDGRSWVWGRASCAWRRRRSCWRRGRAPFSLSDS